MAKEHEAGLVICVTGPESTGKTTLAGQLAAALGAPLVEEAARAMLADAKGRALRRSDLAIAIPGSADRNQKIAPAAPGPGYTRAEVLAIARAQFAAEQAALATGASVVVADTDLTVIRVWWEVRYGTLDPWIARELGRLGPRRYLLMLPDIAWEPDPLRESPHDREPLLGRYRSLLAELGFPHVEIGGLGVLRFERAWAAVQGWLVECASGGPPDAAP